MNDIERFWSYVDVKGEDECWEWKGRIQKNGYGQIIVKGKTYTAHRFAYIVTYGEVEEDLCVCHTCDNKPCCNPKHLWKGTPQANVKDMMNKGRHSRGHDISDIMDVRMLYKAGYSLECIRYMYESILSYTDDIVQLK